MSILWKQDGGGGSVSYRGSDPPLSKYRKIDNIGEAVLRTATLSSKFITKIAEELEYKEIK